MYDVVVVGQGFTGLLSAIIAKKHHKKVALVANGTGKLLQSTGVMDLVPGSNKNFDEWLAFLKLEKFPVRESVKQFKEIIESLNFPYNGEVDRLVPIVTASGHIKMTALYPETITPIPNKGNIVIVGFNEIVDFQPEFLKWNLQKVRPDLNIYTMKISLGKQSQRTLTQLDAARILDEKDWRAYCLNQIKKQTVAQNLDNINLFIMPSCLGLKNWQEVFNQFQSELQTKVTEAPGLPPNTTSVRLYEVLRKEAVKLGVRFYLDTEVRGCTINCGKLTDLTVHTSNRSSKIASRHTIIATGGILGGGLEVTGDGLKETALQLEVDQTGVYRQLPENVYPVGGALGTAVTLNGIPGGIYSIFSCFEAISQINIFELERGLPLCMS
jgi:glycerol-3-phosphate dehydrogenase subunit B